MLKTFQEYYRRHQRLVLPAAIFSGFVVDVITLRQVDGLFENVVFMSHIFITLLVFSLIFCEDTRVGRFLKISNNKPIYETILIFSFGALFSGFTIVYLRSGSLLSSWPFILTMFALMVAVEVKKDYFLKQSFQMGVIYIALFSYFVILGPLVFREIDDWVFIVSGVASLIVMNLYFSLLRLAHNKKYKTLRTKFMRNTFLIFLVMNFLYFTNVIPPVPLSLKFKAVYHEVTKVSEGNYIGIYEYGKYLQIFRQRSRVIHRTEGDDIYVFTEVYAPIKISTNIYHRWQRFDASGAVWVDSDRIEISIAGGREDGYRGYSSKVNLSDGQWRVVVENNRGQRLGFIRFKVVNGEAPELLYQEAL